MKKKAVLAELPQSSGNPLLGLEAFRKLCEKRFRGLPLRGQFKKLIERWEAPGIFRPAYFHEGSDTALYSSFQIWQISVMWREDVSRVGDILAKRFRRFDRLLQLLVEIQDLYLPLVRTDRRCGEARDYGEVAIVGGTYFTHTTQYLLSGLLKARQHALEGGFLRPEEVLVKVGMTTQELRSWANDLAWKTRGFDPLQEWRILLSFVSYPVRQELKWDALLAEDYYEMASAIWLFLEDLESEAMNGAIWQGRTLPPVGSSAWESWIQERYGEALHAPFEMLEYLSNRFNLNPKPRGIILTEGEEWAALDALYEHYQYTPRMLGIEFRSIGGEGNFKLANWQCFVEYMHEKQILIYFVIDSEGETARQAKRLLESKRRFQFPNLERVIPAKDRIKIWRNSFEEDNFTDAQIARCLRLQGHSVSTGEVGAVRRDGERKKALISALAATRQLTVNKRRLVRDLVADLIAARKRRPNVKKLRPVERFVRTSGELIMLNHQPTMEKAKKMNMEAGYMG